MRLNHCHQALLHYLGDELLTVDEAVVGQLLSVAFAFPQFCQSCLLEPLRDFSSLDDCVEDVEDGDFKLASCLQEIVKYRLVLDFYPLTDFAEYFPGYWFQQDLKYDPIYFDVLLLGSCHI